MKLRILLALALLLGSAHAAHAEIFRYGTWGTWYLPDAHIFLGAEKGFFKEAGLDVQVIPISGIGDQRIALRRGDVEAVNGINAIFAMHEEAEIRAVLTRKTSYVIFAREGVRTVEDLKGKIVIARGCGTSSALFATALMRDIVERLSSLPIHCGRPKDHPGTIGVYFVPIEGDSNARVQAVAKGEAHAALGSIMEKYKLPTGVHVAGFSDNLAEVPETAVVMLKKIAKEKEGQVAALMRGIASSIAWFERHPAEAGAYIGKVGSIPQSHREEVRLLLLDMWTKDGRIERGPAVRWMGLASPKSSENGIVTIDGKTLSVEELFKHALK